MIINKIFKIEKYFLKLLLVTTICVLITVVPRKLLHAAEPKQVGFDA
jgi:hypothetical protein